MFIICGIELIAQLIRCFPEASVKLIQKGLLLTQIRRYNSTWLDLTWLDLTLINSFFCSCRLVIIGVDYSNLWVVLKCCFWCGFRPKGWFYFSVASLGFDLKGDLLSYLCKKVGKEHTPDNLLFFISRSGRRRIFKLAPILSDTAWQNGDSNTKNSPSHFAAYSGKL